MGNYFPRWTNWLPLKLAIALVFVIVGVSVGVTYYFTPKYTRVGYQPTQPVPFSHKIHAGQLGMDCRFCHAFGEISGPQNVPANQVCFNCHGVGKGNIRSASPKLAKVMEAEATGKPIDWVKIHRLPDYAYFNHSAHVNRGVSCVSCHGKVNEMDVVFQDQPQSMGWCLNCHREPENNLRPLTEITNLNWEPGSVNRESFYKGLLDKGAKAEDVASAIPGADKTDKADMKSILDLAAAHYGEKVTQREIGLQLKKHWQVQPPDSCTACHR